MRKAVIDAESFRGLRLYSKAIETLRIALEMDPLSTEIREKLRDVLAEAGDRDGAIGEMISLAALYIDRGDGHLAEVELYQVLEAEPGHATACEMLEQMRSYGNRSRRTPTSRTTARPPRSRIPTSSAIRMLIGEAEVVSASYDPEEPLPSYDFEEVLRSAAMREHESRSGFDRHR